MHNSNNIHLSHMHNQLFTSSTNNNNNQCNINEIYCDEPSSSIHNHLPLNVNHSSSCRKILTEKKGILCKHNDTDVSHKLSLFKDICDVCKDLLDQGEIVYYCLCEKFYHPNCLIQINKNYTSQPCNECLNSYSAGIYKLKSPISSLNTNEKAYANENNINTPLRSSASYFDKSTMISMDTNINQLENYEKICDLASQMNTESLAEIIKLDNNMSLLGTISAQKDDAMMNVSFKRNDVGDGNRIALSPITGINTPYSGKSKFMSSTASDMFHKYENKNGSNSGVGVENGNSNSNCGGSSANNNLISSTPNYKVDNSNSNSLNNINNDIDNSPEISFNKVRQHLTFLSNKKNEAPLSSSRCVASNNNTSNNNNNNSTSSNKNINISLYSIFETQVNNNNNSGCCNINTNNNNNTTLNSSLINSNISFRNLLYDDIDEETSCIHEDDDDKENCPPLPKETSLSDSHTYSSSSPQHNYDNLIECSIEGGISHIISDSNKIVNIPISIDIQFNKNIKPSSLNFNYSKDTLLIFNTNELNISTLLQILKIAYDKMNNNDRIYSNIFNINQFLTKNALMSLLSSPNAMNNFVETAILSYEDITKLILYAIDLSFEFHSNVFSVLFVTNVNDIHNDIDYSNHIREITMKLKDTKINLLKQFTINCIILDDISKTKSLSNVHYISFLYELTMICFGYFYSPKNANELMKAMMLFYSTLEQLTLLNVKLIIKGNKDPSIYLEGMNYLVNKKSHNNYEIYVGGLLHKEKKIVNLNADVILNNSDLALNLPLLEVSCEYIVPKAVFNSNSDILLFNNNMNGNNNLLRHRTDYYSLSIPIITQHKEVLNSNTVWFRYVITKTVNAVMEGIEKFKAFQFDDASAKFYEAKMNFDKMIQVHTSLFGYLQLLAEQSVLGINNVSCSSNKNNNNNNNNNISEDDCSFHLSTVNTNSVNLSKVLNLVMMIFNDLNFLLESSKNKNINAICTVYSIGEALSFYRCVMLDDERFIGDNLY